jgi:hypothetical protein
MTMTSYIDVYRSVLCGTQINEPFNSSVIADTPVTTGLPFGSFGFRSLSLVVGVDDGVLKSFMVLTSNDRAFKRWSWLYDGNPLSLSIETSPSDLSSMIGAAIDSWDDGIEGCRTFSVLVGKLRGVWDIDRKLLKSLEWDES